MLDDGVLTENGELIFGIVEKKTVGASQDDLVHVVFREKGAETTHQLFTGKWWSTTGSSTMASV